MDPSNDLPALLDVYRMCEDFLSLGPIAHASAEMVLTDLAHSQEDGGIYCSIIAPSGEVVGVIDFVPHGYQAQPDTAYLSLLMIASPHRSKGLGEMVVRAVEDYLCSKAPLSVIKSGVQVNNPGAIRFWLRMGYEITSGPIDLPDQTTVFNLEKKI